MINSARISGRKQIDVQYIEQYNQQKPSCHFYQFSICQLPSFIELEFFARKEKHLELGKGVGESSLRESVERSPNPLLCLALFSPQAITEKMLFSIILVQIKNVSRSLRLDLVTKAGLLNLGIGCMSYHI